MGLNPREQQWLHNNPRRIRAYEESANFSILQGRPVNFADLAAYGVDHYREAAGLRAILSHDTFEFVCYPRCVRLFEANLVWEFQEQTLFTSEVKGVRIRITDTEFGELLGIPSQGIDLEDVEMTDPQILHHIFHRAPGQWQTGNMRDSARLVTRIVQHNIIPKTGSYDQIYPAVRKATYAIMGGIQVNWARSLMIQHTGQASGPRRSYIPYGNLYTLVF